MTVAPGEMHFRTLNLQMNFVRIGRAQLLSIDARVVACTRQMITVRSDFRSEDGELLAEASAQQLLMPFDHWPAERAAIERMTAG